MDLSKKHSLIKHNDNHKLNDVQNEIKLFTVLDKMKLKSVRSGYSRAAQLIVYKTIVFQIQCRWSLLLVTSIIASVNNSLEYEQKFQ